MGEDWKSSAHDQIDANDPERTLPSASAAGARKCVRAREHLRLRDHLALHVAHERGPRRIASAAGSVRSASCARQWRFLWPPFFGPWWRGRLLLWTKWVHTVESDAAGQQVLCTMVAAAEHSSSAYIRCMATQ